MADVWYKNDPSDAIWWKDTPGRISFQTDADELRLNVAQMVCIIYKQDTNGIKNLDFSGFGVIKEIIQQQKSKDPENHAVFGVFLYMC